MITATFFVRDRDRLRCTRRQGPGFIREKFDGPLAAVPAISWVVPDRPLSREIARVLEAGYVRGADCWHLATALYLAEERATIPVLTLDERQREVADGLGFPA